MGFREIGLDSSDDEHEDFDLEASSAVEIDLTGKKTADDYRDEAETDVEVELEAEVAGDTEDAPAEESEEDVTDSDLSHYSKSVRKRIAQLTKKHKQESSAKEQALNAKLEAEELAKNLLVENRRLKGDVNKNQSALIEQAKQNIATEVNKARQEYKDAYDAGDADKILDAQEKLTTANAKSERLERFKPAPLQEEQEDVTIPPAQDPATLVDDKALDWSKRNPWFGDTDETEMTYFARGVHDRLVRQGVDQTSDAYYKAIDDRMREVFPDKFEDSPAKRTPKRSNVVAPNTRSVASRTIKLKASEQRIADKLGISYEQYAREVSRLQRN
jgi:hypothetical protein